jgi:hypothetical protein
MTDHPRLHSELSTRPPQNTHSGTEVPHALLAEQHLGQAVKVPLVIELHYVEHPSDKVQNSLVPLPKARDASKGMSR